MSLLLTIEKVIQFVEAYSFQEEEQICKTINKVSIIETLWRGVQPSWTLTSNKLRLVLTKNGLNIASVSLVDDDTNTNPFWVPKWPWNDPLQPRLQHGKISGEMELLYGNYGESQLLSNLCGHNMCCDRFGLCKASDDPQRTCHGEAPINLYRLSEPDKGSGAITFHTTLKAAKLNMERTFTFLDATNTVVVSTTLESRESGKTTRSDVEWCEHVTLGDPFLNGATFTANVDNAYNFADPLPNSRWNEYPLAERLPSVEECLSLPKMEDKSIEIEEVTCLRVEDNNEHLGTFNARNDELGFELTYKWDSKVFPWLAVWSEHYGRHHAPWNAQERTRGLEFCTKPFPIPALETHKVVKDKIYTRNKTRMFEGRSIELALGPSGRTEVFTFQWKRISDTF